MAGRSNRPSNASNAATNIQYSHNAYGQPTTLSRPHGQGDVTYLYDDMAQLTKVDSGSGDADYLYDDELRVTKTAYDNYTDASYQYDAGGRLTKLINNFDTASYTQTYDYDHAGNRTKTTMSGSLSGSIAYYYDDVFQLTRETRSGTSNNYDHQYWFDAAGNRTKRVKGGATTTFLYNNVNQLTKASVIAQVTNGDFSGGSSGWTISGGTVSGGVLVGSSSGYFEQTIGGLTPGATYTYSFDASGGGYEVFLTLGGNSGTYYIASGANTFSEQIVAGSSDSKLKITFYYGNYDNVSLTGGVDTTYSYDDNGSLTKKYKDANNLTAYYWDSRNLMTKVTVTVSGTPTDHTFAYDALGRRKSMTTGGTTTEYMYEGLKVLVEKTGGLTKRYTNGPQAVGGIISKDDGTDTTYYHYDAIGNVLLTSDGDGYVDETFVQDAYGNVISGTASGYHLTTKEYFPAFGLYYFNARWYDPEIGRFVSRDLLKLDGPNMYQFCYNNPLLFIDIDGMTVRAMQGITVNDTPTRGTLTLGGGGNSSGGSGGNSRGGGRGAGNTNRARPGLGDLMRRYPQDNICTRLSKWPDWEACDSSTTQRNDDFRNKYPDWYFDTYGFPGHVWTLAIDPNGKCYWMDNYVIPIMTPAPENPFDPLIPDIINGINDGINRWDPGNWDFPIYR